VIHAFGPLYSQGPGQGKNKEGRESVFRSWEVAVVLAGLFVLHSALSTTAARSSTVENSNTLGQMNDGKGLLSLFTAKRE